MDFVRRPVLLFILRNHRVHNAALKLFGWRCGACLIHDGHQNGNPSRRNGASPRIDRNGIKRTEQSAIIGAA